MRKIEQWMIDTIESQRLAHPSDLMNDGLTATRENTKVTTRIRQDNEAVTTVYLHDNMIAQFSKQSWGFKLAGWNTPTTRSRINALARHWGCNGVHQSKGKLFSGEKEVNSIDWFF